MARKTKKGSGEATVSLFPFLAVLLCTMGMLVMLLVLMSQGRSGDSAHGPKPEEVVAQPEPVLPEPKKPEKEAKDKSVIPDELRRQYEELRAKFVDMPVEELKKELESGDWFLNELTSVNKRTLDALKAERDRLASLESAMSARLKEVERLQESIRLLDEKDTGASDAAKLVAELDGKKKRIETLKNEIETLEKANANASQSFAIVPYRGSNGTRRRPIYIECTETGIKLMPEEIAFSVEDFLLAKYPGNPFDTALRTARSCLIEKYGTDAGEPYPLLIVRPGGADKYYAAVAALASWGGDYGYEFVDQDWKIEYPGFDDQTSKRIYEQVSISRRKLAFVLQSMLAASPGLRDRAFSSDETGGTFKTGVAPTSSGLLNQLGEHVRLSADAGTEPGTGTTFDSGSGAAAFAQNAGDGMYRGASGMPGYAANGAPGVGMTGMGVEGRLNPYRVDKGTLGSSDAFAGTSTGRMSAVALESNERLPAYVGMYAQSARDSVNTTGPVSPVNTTNTTTATVPTNAANTTSTTPAQTTGNGATPAGVSGTVAAGRPGQERGETAFAQSASPVNTVATVAGDRTTGTPATDPSAQILAHLQETTDTNTSGETLENGWVTVGNTAMQPRNGATSQVAAAGAENMPDMSGAVNQPLPIDDPREPLSGANMPQAMLTKSKTVSKEKEKDKKEFSVYDSYKQEGINLTEQLRQPVNSMVERPIRVECYADRIVFPKQPGVRAERVLPLSMDRKALGEQLQRDVAFCVKGWGVAGRNMYWSPWIRVRTMPGGESAQQYLAAFFKPQGIAVRLETAQEQTKEGK